MYMRRYMIVGRGPAPPPSEGKVMHQKDGILKTQNAHNSSQKAPICTILPGKFTIFQDASFGSIKKYILCFLTPEKPPEAAPLSQEGLGRHKTPICSQHS